MTDKRMALVPREADYYMKLAGSAENFDADRESFIWDAMTGNAPHGGKVSRERLLKAVYANCTAASAFGCECVCIGLSPCEWHIKQTRAVIAALGLEIEE